ncbi:MAG TPA: carboxypeptidase regulatory-like domain-containing protein, partial [Pyrinomonadaceae bacterium]|nr:carboxypeptidase regulatory-like domain-containing protein [Pyrinomonadaceae bacterium]
MARFRLDGTRFLLIVLISLVFPIVGYSQSTAGNISGIVTDVNGAIVPGATVTLISEQNGSTRTEVSNEEGRFQFSTVQPGPYTLKIEHQGFQTLQRTKTILSANETLALGDLKLTAGSISEVVTVASSGATVERESSDLTARLTSDQIDLISTKGRDITSLLRLIPGTTNENDIEAVGEGFGTDLPFISGQRGRSTVPMVDGLNAGEPSGSNKVSMSTSQDAISEVKVLRNNYAAEYGNNGGAIISIVSKGGTKSYRGSAYYFIRNEALNATNYFINQQGLPRPIYRHNIWGFNYGGPLPLPRFGETEHMFLKNKAFFFINYEKPHTITPTNPIFVTVPTALERAGDFSQSLNSSGQPFFIADPLLAQQGKVCSSADTSGCFHDLSRATASNPTGLNIIPLNRFNQSTAALLTVFPLPNTDVRNTNGGLLYNFVTQKSVDVPKRSLLIRFDVKPTQNDSIFYKKQWFRSDNVGLGTSGWPSGDQNR